MFYSIVLRIKVRIGRVKMVIKSVRCGFLGVGVFCVSCFFVVVFFKGLN